MSTEKLKESLKEILPDNEWEDEELANYITLALLDTSTVVNIVEGTSFEDLTEPLQKTVMVGAKALALRKVAIAKAKEQTTFGEKEMVMDLDTGTSNLLRAYHETFEEFKSLCKENQGNIKIVKK